MKGKVVVITGATSGIGQVAAERLAAMGARLVVVARDRDRGEAALLRLRERRPDATHQVHYADLSRLAEMKRVAAAIAAAEPRIDVLINNAGAMFGTRQVTPDGFERTFALNHLAYYVVTCGLKGSLIAGAPARIVSTASDAHRGNQLDFNDLQSARNYRGFTVYGRTKLMNILFTRELAKRLSGTGVVANALHPGFVATRFGDESGGLTAWGVRFAKLFAISPADGAETIVYLASSPQAATVSGGYFYKSRPATPTAAAQDDTAAARLWAETEKLTAMTW
jgi:NAD(P)-dependent dehydrogenase (short-subunit alcohol dehydrogenase family)